MANIIGANRWTDVDQANYEQGFDDAKFGEVELRSHPAYKKGYAIAKGLPWIENPDMVEDTNRF